MRKKTKKQKPCCSEETVQVIDCGGSGDGGRVYGGKD